MLEIPFVVLFWLFKIPKTETVKCCIFLTAVALNSLNNDRKEEWIYLLSSYRINPSLRSVYNNASLSPGRCILMYTYCLSRNVPVFIVCIHYISSVMLEQTIQMSFQEHCKNCFNLIILGNLVIVHISLKKIQVWDLISFILI